MRTKTEEKRQAILEVAATVFAEMGFERTSMAEICARLGGSKATLYNYFPSKEALFLEVMFIASKAEFEQTMQALQVGDADVTGALRNFGRRFLGLLYSPNVMAVRRLLVAEGGRAQLGQRCFEQGPKRTYASIAAFLSEAMHSGWLRPAPTELATRHLHALLEAELIAGFLFQHHEQPDAAELTACADRAIDAFMHLYRANV